MCMMIGSHFGVSAMFRYLFHSLFVTTSHCCCSQAIDVDSRQLFTQHAAVTHTVTWSASNGCSSPPETRLMLRPMLMSSVCAAISLCIRLYFLLCYYEVALEFQIAPSQSFSLSFPFWLVTQELRGLLACT